MIHAKATKNTQFPPPTHLINHLWVGQKAPPGLAQLRGGEEARLCFFLGGGYHNGVCGAVVVWWVGGVYEDTKS